MNNDFFSITTIDGKLHEFCKEIKEDKPLNIDRMFITPNGLIIYFIKENDQHKFFNNNSVKCSFTKENLIKPYEVTEQNQLKILDIIFKIEKIEYKINELQDLLL